MGRASSGWGLISFLAALGAASLVYIIFSAKEMAPWALLFFGGPALFLGLVALVLGIVGFVIKRADMWAIAGVLVSAALFIGFFSGFLRWLFSP